MLRVYFLQRWFNLSDPGTENALYESPVVRHFVGIHMGRAPAPDESTILQFRHLLEKHTGRGDAERGQSVSGKPGHPHHHRDDRRRDHCSHAFVDQEHVRGARSANIMLAWGVYWCG